MTQAWRRQTGPLEVEVSRDTRQWPSGEATEAVSAPGSPNTATDLTWKLWIYTNYDCNLSCSYCLAESTPQAQRRGLDLETAQQLVDEATALDFRQVFLTGGEPFILEDIYANYWNYNGGLYHWLEVALSGYPTSGAVPVEAVGWGPIRAAKWIVGGALVLVLAAVWWACRRCGDDLTLLRLSAVPLAAYLLLATTVHPWYVTLLVPLLPFLTLRKGEATQVGRFLVPALYFTAAVALSYTRYMDPANLREYDAVRLVEYLPVYLLLIWAAWPATGVFGAFGRG